MDCILDSIKHALGNYLSLEPTMISDDAELYESLGIDSSGIVNLLLELEQSCKVEFDMEALQPEHLSTVGSLAKVIEELSAIQDNREER